MARLRRPEEPSSLPDSRIGLLYVFWIFSCDFVFFLVDVLSCPPIEVSSMRVPALIFDFGNVVGYFDYLRACERFAGHLAMSGPA